MNAKTNSFSDIMSRNVIARHKAWPVLACIHKVCINKGQLCNIKKEHVQHYICRL